MSIIDALIGLCIAILSLAPFVLAAYGLERLLDMIPTDNKREAEINRRAASARRIS
jgi:hypothetical protein